MMKTFIAIIILAASCFGQNSINNPSSGSTAGPSGSPTNTDILTSNGTANTVQDPGGCTMTSTALQCTTQTIGVSANASTSWIGFTSEHFYSAGTRDLRLQQSSVDKFEWTNGPYILDQTTGVLGWTIGGADTGLSRDSAGVVDVGTGAQGSTAGSMKLTNLFLSGTVQNVAATAVMGMTLKKGTGAGNYTSASTTYVVVDSTNLCFTVTIPTGWKLGIQAGAALGTATGAVVASMAITDNASCATANAGILVETTETTTAAATLQAISTPPWVITGDGASHNIALQFKTSNASDSVTILNSSATSLPTMVFTLMPSN